MIKYMALISPSLNIECIEFSIDDVLSSISDVLSLKAGDKGIEFIISKGEKVPAGLVGDPLRLGQILLNLTNNAIKFTDNGEVIIDVRVEKMTKKQVWIKFSIKDTGIGMTEEQISKLFSAFMQADASTTRKYGGTGLGLSISKNLVEMMGGQLSVNSQYGKGSEFFFTCHFKTSARSEITKEIIPHELEDLKVLLVEDNAYTREVIESYLHSFGFNTRSVSCGEDAVEESGNYFFDLLLIDYMMPGINGVETWVKIKKKLDKEKHPKIMLISSYSKKELYEEADKAGIDEILAKPITQSTLFNAIVNVFLENRNREIGKNNNYPKGFDEIRGAVILVVEDNEINQQIVKELLEIEGFWVEIAENGQIAINKINENNHYDLILMDLQMPIMDGYTAANKLRNDHKISTPIIALSADAMEGTGTAAKEAGMNDYISKPIDIQELFGVMATYIDPKERKKNEEKTTNKFTVSDITLRKILSNLDTKDGLKRLSGNTNLYLSILRKFARKNMNFTAQLKTLLRDGKSEESKKLLHRMKGVSGNIGAMNLNRMIKDLEHKMITINSDGKDFDEELDDIESEFESILVQIKKMMNIVEKNNVTGQDNKKTEDKNAILKLKTLFEMLTQYDINAKYYYEELKKIKFDSSNESFEKMGEFIDDYDFDSASEICGKMITEGEKKET